MSPKKCNKNDRYSQDYLKIQLFNNIDIILIFEKKMLQF